MGKVESVLLEGAETVAIAPVLLALPIEEDLMVPGRRVPTPTKERIPMDLCSRTTPSERATESTWAITSAPCTECPQLVRGAGVC